MNESKEPLSFTTYKCDDPECDEHAVWSFHTYMITKPLYGHGWPKLCPEHAQEYHNWVHEQGGMVTANNWMCAD